jgi:muconolactone delta-isomerase
MKFLVLWSLAIERLSEPMLKAVLRVPEYAHPLEAQGKIEKRYHIVGRHGGAWIFQVESNEELERLLAMSPVYNYARYEVLPLADMESPTAVLRSEENRS